jgi:alpha-amylase
MFINRQIWSFFCRYITLAIVWLWVATIVFPSPAKADVIYQAFNLPFQEVKTKLPELKEQGYTHIQISPPQKSNPSSEWWARYQPLDFTVLESPLGNESDLKELIEAAHQQGEKIIIDVVLNHMADYPPYSSSLEYPRFSPQDFHPKACINNYSDRYQVTYGWLGCSLPDLNTESDYVRQEGKQYLQKLLALGADGFRFDAIKHIEPEYFEDVLQVVPSDKYLYGELIEGRPNESFLYTEIHDLDISDYPLLETIKQAFSFGGDLRSLIAPQSSNGALPGVNAVTFAQTHDTVEGGDLYNSYGLEERDAMLANAYVLAREEGFPLIYRDDASYPIVQAGISFHEQMLTQPQDFRNGNEIAQGADSPNLLFIERGSKGIAIINKSGNSFDVQSAKMPGLDVGCYKELQHHFTISVAMGDDGQKYITQWGTPERKGMQIGPRDALFFVQTVRENCQ